MPNPGLNPNDVIAVSISLTATPAGFQNFGSCMALGPSDVIDTNERRRKYADLTEVAVDFPSTSPEFAFAENFFAQVPRPNLLYIGRWAQAATSGVLNGASLTPAQRLLGSFNAVSAGAMLVTVDGVPNALVGLDFSQAVNLNGVASTIQTALVAAGCAGATVVWDAENFRFIVESGTSGPGSSVGYVAAPTAIDAATFASNPSANSTLTLNGTAVTFVASGATGNQVNIGSSLSATLTNLLLALRASTDTQIQKFRYLVVGSTLYTIAAQTGAAGNGLTVTSTAASVATGVTAGGAGTDVSVLLGLSATPTSSGANADAPVGGIAAEALLNCLSYFDQAFSDWYAVAFAAPGIADSDHLAAAEYIEGAGRPRVYGISSANTEFYDDTRTDDLASILNQGAYSRTMIEFSTTTPYAVASLFGRFATVNYQGSDTTITLKFKQMPGVVAETVTETQAATLDAKKVNYFVNYQNGASILQQGVMCSGIFIDSRINADWLANYVQTNAFNFIAGLQTKLPQTDRGMSLLKTNITASMRQGVINGYLAPGVWNADGFGAIDDTGRRTLEDGDFLPLGFLIYVPLVATQNETDRALRKTPPFQIAAKEAGAAHSANIAITVNP